MDSAENEVSILLEILDLEYLKPILIDRFDQIDELASKTNAELTEIGIRNPNDLAKLRHALDEIDQQQQSTTEYGPILSADESGQIISRIENETNLIGAGLNLLLNHNINSDQTSLLPRDDGTSEIDYRLYNSEIDEIVSDVEQLQNYTEQLIEEIETQFPQLHQEQLNDRSVQRTNQVKKQVWTSSVLIVLTAVACVTWMIYLRRK